MKEMFMSRTELNHFLPWSKNVVGQMIEKGFFIPIRNPACPGRSKMFFWRPQVEETLEAMLSGTLPRQNQQKPGGFLQKRGEK